MNNIDHIIKTEQKALEINLDDAIYGTFAEIGAGQEVARNFFQVGAAAGTIAKTMSAYDKIYSDKIYGEEESGRYVCENRVYKMLDHEYHLLDDRLTTCALDRTFFVFADTVAAVNYNRTIKGNGWLGIRFQLRPCTEPNELILHVKMHDTDNRLQQEAIGVLGVNMLYACYFLNDDIEKFVVSLVDGLQGRVSIDMVRLTGEDFIDLDNRLLSLYLVKHGLTEVTMFNNNKKPIHASEFLYKQSLMVVRGNFKPSTKVTEDVFECSFKQFIKEDDVDPEHAKFMAEITIDNLLDENGNIDEQDFLDRTDLLGLLGHKIIISSCTNHQDLINYLHDYKISHLGLVIGAYELTKIIQDKYEENRDGRLLAAFGELFSRNIRIYVYPAIMHGNLVHAENLPVPEGIRFLYQHLLDCQQIEPVEEYNEELLSILSWEVLNQIVSGDDKWKNSVPDSFIPFIQEKKLFSKTELETIDK